MNLSPQKNYCAESAVKKMKYFSKVAWRKSENLDPNINFDLHISDL